MKHLLSIVILIGSVSAVLAVGSVSALLAAPRIADPDWPCIQPLVPVLSAGMLWSGPAIDGDWHAEPKVAALVEKIAPRRVTAAEGEQAITEFTKALGPERGRLRALAFAGLLEESNHQRGEVITKIKDLAERQRKVADLVSELTTQMDALPLDPVGEEAVLAKELNERWSFVSRTHTEVQRTMRYICEIPVQIDSRLGNWARALGS